MTVDDLKTLVHNLADTNTSNFSDAKMVSFFNKNQNEIVNIILENDDFAIYDDQNYGDLNDGTIDLTSGQSIYDLSEDENFADLLFVVKVLIKDAAGNWIELSRKSVVDPELSSSLRGVTYYGRSRYFRMSGKRLILDFAPNYTQSAGIKIFFIRQPKEILVSDTTREIGIPATYHQLLALMTCYDYARAKRLDNRNEFLNEVNEEKERLANFLQSQGRDVNNRIRTKRKLRG